MARSVLVDPQYADLVHERQLRDREQQRDGQVEAQRLAAEVGAVRREHEERDGHEREELAVARGVHAVVDLLPERGAVVLALVRVLLKRRTLRVCVVRVAVAVLESPGRRISRGLLLLVLQR